MLFGSNTSAATWDLGLVDRVCSFVWIFDIVSCFVWLVDRMYWVFFGHMNVLFDKVCLIYCVRVALRDTSAEAWDLGLYDFVI
jgi:hypothetical protein